MRGRRSSSLLMRGLLARRSLAVAVLIAAGLTTAAAALGPMYARAAAESTLRDELVAAPAESTGLHLAIAAPPDDTALPPAQFDGAVREAPKALPHYGPPIGMLNWPLIAFGGGDAARSAAVWRDGECAHLVLTSGRCPERAGEAVISARTLQISGIRWRLGTVLTLADPIPGSTETLQVRVVGTYRPASVLDPFWFGVDYFEEGEDAQGNIRVDTIFVARAAFTRLVDSEVHASLDYPFRPTSVRLADVPALRTEVDRLQHRHPDSARLALTTGLGDVLDAAAHQQQLVDIGTLLVTLQLSLLGWLVLFQIVTDLAEARGPEIALAKLRGHRPWQVLRFGIAEPVVLLAIATPVGIALAALAAVALGGSVLVPGTPVVVTLPAIAAAAAAFAGGVVATLLAGARVLRRPVLEQWRRTMRSRRPTRVSLVVDLAAAALAIAAFAVLRTLPAAAQGTAALLAPGLLVLAVALAGVRLLPVVVRLTLPATRAGTRIGLFLATRQVVRRPAGVRLATLLAVAAGLAAFAVGAEGTAVGNRLTRAQAEVGAATVVDVQVTGTADPVETVRRLDPSGTWAMAAATWLPDGGGSVAGTVLAVDASRLAAVGDRAAGGLDPRVLARAVTARTVPPIVVRGTRIEATISASQLRRGSEPQVQFDLRTSARATVSAESTVLRPGTHLYSAAVPCAGGCTLTGLTWDRPVTVDGEMAGTALLTGLRAGDPGRLRPLPARLDDRAAWRAATPVSEARDTVSVESAGVLDHFSGDSGYGGVAYASTPAVLSAVGTPDGLVHGPATGPPTIVDSFGGETRFRTVAMSPVLPAVLDAGVLMDAAGVEDLVPAFRGEASWQVWLSAAAPSDAVQRIARAGLIVQRVSTTAQREKVLGRQGPALSLLLLLASAVVGAVLAAVGTAVSIGASARRRSYELAALHAVGVRRAALFRAAVAEQSLLLLTALALGIPAGLLAAFLTLPVLPEFATETPVALRFTPDLPPVALFAAVFVVLVLIAAVVSAAAVLARSRPARLREAEE
ncbi:MAG TPA: FtsX-like permease family protein [Amnibacterium sp.]|nr:FtsX-like permease family protein [Amnibacterium sp.]